MFGKKGLLGIAIEAPYKVVEFTGETLFGRDDPQQTRKAYRSAQRCPVCNGRGTPGPCFYEHVTCLQADLERDRCRTCNGKGIV